MILRSHITKARHYRVYTFFCYSSALQVVEKRLVECPGHLAQVAILCIVQKSADDAGVNDTPDTLIVKSRWALWRRLVV